jgi:hypothetical protein
MTFSSENNVLLYIYHEVNRISANMRYIADICVCVLSIQSGPTLGDPMN